MEVLPGSFNEVIGVHKFKFGIPFPEYSWGRG